jgi:hypothetical protein
MESSDLRKRIYAELAGKPPDYPGLTATAIAARIGRRVGTVYAELAEMETARLVTSTRQIESAPALWLCRNRTPVLRVSG